MGRLPRPIITERILPQAAQDTFVLGFAGANRAARALVIEAACHVRASYAHQQAQAACAALSRRPPAPPQQPTHHSWELHRQACRLLDSCNSSSTLYEAQRDQHSGDLFGALWRLARAKEVWPTDLRVHRAFGEIAYSLCERYHVCRKDILAPWHDQLRLTQNELKAAHDWVGKFVRWDRQVGGLFEGALQSYEMLLVSDPRDVPSLLNAGDLLCWQHHDQASKGQMEEGSTSSYEAIVPYFEDAIRLQPSSAEAHFRLGRCHKQFGQPLEAMASFSRSLKYGLPPAAMAEAHLACAEICDSSGRRDAALNRYLFVLHHMDPPYRCRAAWKLRRLGHFEEG